MHCPPVELVTPRKYTARRGVTGEDISDETRQTIATKTISKTMIQRSAAGLIKSFKKLSTVHNSDSGGCSRCF